MVVFRVFKTETRARHEPVEFEFQILEGFGSGRIWWQIYLNSGLGRVRVTEIYIITSSLATANPKGAFIWGIILETCSMRLIAIVFSHVSQRSEEDTAISCMLHVAH